MFSYEWFLLGSQQHVLPQPLAGRVDFDYIFTLLILYFHNRLKKKIKMPGKHFKSRSSCWSSLIGSYIVQSDRELHCMQLCTFTRVKHKETYKNASFLVVFFFLSKLCSTLYFLTFLKLNSIYI